MVFNTTTTLVYELNILQLSILLVAIDKQFADTKKQSNIEVFAKAVCVPSVACAMWIKTL